MEYTLKNTQTLNSKLIDIAMTNIVLLVRNSNDVTLTDAEQLEASKFIDEIKNKLATV